MTYQKINNAEGANKVRLFILENHTDKCKGCNNGQALVAIPIANIYMCAVCGTHWNMDYPSLSLKRLD